MNNAARLSRLEKRIVRRWIAWLSYVSTGKKDRAARARAVLEELKEKRADLNSGPDQRE